MSREVIPVVVPVREEGDNPGKYLERLEAAVAKSMIATILSKSADPFAQSVLRSYTRRFPFFGEPIDMSLRKFLLEAELPKETQQVDRVIQAFADRYHECNPGIFGGSDQAYVVAFSLMMLHTDAFNRNNKRKMGRSEYVRNTQGQGVGEEVLGCFYDNICYTPFVHYEEEVDINGERVLPFKPKKSKLKGGAISVVESTSLTGGGAAASSGKEKKMSGPLDPYNLLIEQRLDALRPALKEILQLEDPYNYRAAGQPDLDPVALQRAFTHTGVLQILSPRSRPAAYDGPLLPPTPGISSGLGFPATPSEAQAQAGIVSLKITKVGVLWRKRSEKKKKKVRSPWQEWGAILTGSQLYLFKNAGWAKGLMQQFSAAQVPHTHHLPHPHHHERAPARDRVPVVFRPPLQVFKPDALVKTDEAVALVDRGYTRHKNAFVFVSNGGDEEVFLADDATEREEWLGLINYAAAFRGAGVRIRGMAGGAGGSAEDSEVKRLESVRSTRSLRSAAGETVTVSRQALSGTLQRQVMAARRSIMLQRIVELGAEVETAERHVENSEREARQLMVLSPISPKSKEAVVSAAQLLAVRLMGARKDVWRLRCWRDILVADVRLEGDVAGLPATLLPPASQSPRDAKLDDKKRKDKLPLLRLTSRVSQAVSGSPASSNATAVHRSPPLSPTSPTRSPRSARPSTTGSSGVETPKAAAQDVFLTPPESTATDGRPQSQQRDSEGWRLPPLRLDHLVQSQAPDMGEEPRSAVSGPLLTVGSSLGGGSLSQASSTASNITGTDGGNDAVEQYGHRREMQDITPTATAASSTSYEQSEAPMKSSEQAAQVQRLVRRTSDNIPMFNTPPHNAPLSLDGTAAGAIPASVVATPESKHRTSVRKSLQKTLRGSSNHHRRAKDSSSTILSSTGETAAAADPHTEASAVKPDEDFTPGLQRDGKRFLLHGKQASVVQFGGEWSKPNSEPVTELVGERMKMRRTLWRGESSGSAGTVDREPESSQGGHQEGAGSHDASRSLTGSEQRGQDYFPASNSNDGSIAARTPMALQTQMQRISGSERASQMSPDSVLRSDAEAAFAYAAASPTHGQASRPSSDASASGVGRPKTEYFDFEAFEENTHTTTARKASVGTYVPTSLPMDAESDDEDFSLGPRVRVPTGSPPPTEVSATKAGAERDVEREHWFGGDHDSDEGEVDDSMIERPIGDEELRRVSTVPAVSPL